MILTITGLALPALAMLLGTIAAIVAMRLRVSGQFGLHHSLADHPALPIPVERQKPATGYMIEPLTVEMRNHFITKWHSVQAQFVDDPRKAVTRADNLLAAALATRGYPLPGVAQRAHDPSADHGEVQYYSTGDTIADAPAHRGTTTEDLRTAMIHFRSLFDNLVNEPGEYAREPIRQQNSLS